MSGCCCEVDDVGKAASRSVGGQLEGCVRASEQLVDPAGFGVITQGPIRGSSRDA